VSNTYSEPVTRAEPFEVASPKFRLWNRWTKAILLLAILPWVVSEGISLAAQHGSLRKKLSAHLEAAFGRPVEVGNYHFSFWGGPSLEARSVTVAEDPRFGQEYFLRVDSMAVRLRWRSLLRGHIEFGTLSLTRPSLNLVRDAAGDWNLAEWLPRPAGTPSASVPVGPLLPFPALRFRKIEVAYGRINFKRADEKLPIAFVGVGGTVETDAPGRWRMNLKAVPWRSAVAVQQAGTIHVSGYVGGTSSRLRPAALDLSWTDASVSDVLRLARGDDYGVRGTLALALSARTQDQTNAWAIQGHAELRQLHRWDLALRPDNPAVNLTGQATWYPDSPQMELTEAILEAPHSNVRATGVVSWDHSQKPPRELSGPPLLLVTSSRIDFADLLEWIRAFRPGVADNISLRGLASVRGQLLPGWPPRVVNAAVSGDGADLSGASLPVPAHLGRVQFRYDRGIISFPPVALSFGALHGPQDGSFQMNVSASPRRGALPDWHLTGGTSEMRDLIAAASALGWNASRGWDLAGPLSCDLLWREARDPWKAQSAGWVEFGVPGPQGGAALRVPFLNQPVGQILARVELKAGERHVAVSSAQAFGARWTGTFDRSGPGAEWQFELSANRLAAADLDRWLNPRWRESFLDRMLPFLNPRSPALAVPDELQASGRINLDQFILAPLAVNRLQGDLKIAGRRVEFANATGQFYGGELRGVLDADVQAAPSYDASLDFSRVDLSALSAASPELANLFVGTASGEASFHARGAGGLDLFASLECRGTAQVADAQLRTMNLLESLRSSLRRPGTSAFRQASAAFSCAAGEIQFQDLLLLSPDARIGGSGTIDFKRNLDLQVRVLPAGPAAPAAASSDPAQPAYRLTGPLATPAIARVPPPRRNR
jgi:AsmA-like C-terminal region